LLFGLAQYTQLRNLPVHRAMRRFRADLRDVQDVPAHPGPLPSYSLALHRRDRGRVLRDAGADDERGG
jgi:hypothetical protein